MIPEEYSQKLAAVCKAIANQNRELMREMDDPDFDPAIRLDNTKNNAGYMLTDFFDILQYFPHGSVPREPTDELVTSTDELLAKIRTKYGGNPDVLKEIIRAGQAFRNSKRIWRIKAPILPLSQADYKSQLDAALNNILRALDDLNYELNLMSVNPPTQPAAKVPRRCRGHFYGEKDPTLHKDRNEIVAEMRRRKTKKQLSWSKIAMEMRINSSYSARMRGKTDATWIRYAKSGFSG